VGKEKSDALWDVNGIQGGGGEYARALGEPSAAVSWDHDGMGSGIRRRGGAAHAVVPPAPTGWANAAWRCTLARRRGAGVGAGAGGKGMLVLLLLEGRRGLSGVGGEVVGGGGWLEVVL